MSVIPFASPPECKPRNLRGLLYRLADDGKKTHGVFLLYSDRNKVFEGKTLELPWRDNKRQISCISKGVYRVTPRRSDAKGEHFWIHDVLDRDMILIHVGNFVKDTQGCVLLGSDWGDINGDGQRDLTGSRFAMEKLVSIVGENEFSLAIV